MRQHQLAADLVTRLKTALTAEGEALTQLLSDPAAEVLHALLKNPALDERQLVTLLQRQDLGSELFRGMARLRLCQKTPVILAMLRNPGMPAAIAGQLLARLRLFELLNLCILPGQSSDIRSAAENILKTRLPHEPLGNKITLAKRAPTTVLASLLNEGHPQVIAACLDNPRLQEVAIFQFLSTASSGTETILAIARHPRWKQRKNLQQAILKNSRTPQQCFQQLLPQLSRLEARNLLHCSRLNQQQKAWIVEYVTGH